MSTPKHEIFYNAEGTPVKVQMSWECYQELMNRPAEELGFSLLKDNTIRLPSARNHLMKVDWLVDQFKMLGVDVLPICARAKVLDNFTPAETLSVEFLVRARFLGKLSGYQNAMQCSNAVIDALVESGKFSKCRMKFTGFYRAVQCLRLN